MRYLLLSLSIVLLFVKARGQYTGGNNDGFELASPGVQNNSVNIYKGGSNDGFTATTLTPGNQTPKFYTGGPGDGFDVSSTALVNPLPSIYKGGNNDGSASSLAKQVNKSPGIYSGGAGDGTAIKEKQDQNKLPSIYAGGNDDGYAFTDAPGQNIFLNIYEGGADDGFNLQLVTSQNKSAKPVSLISFSGTRQQDDALLLWQLSAPENIETFEIERSTNNGQSFQSLKKTNADENVNGKITADFTYLDLKAFSITSGNIKYRIKWMDKAGNLKYSPVVTLAKNSEQPIIAVYPNPTNGSFTLELKNVETPVNYKYLLHSITGALIEEGNITSASSHFDLSHLASANYILSIFKDNKLIQNFTIILSR